MSNFNSYASKAGAGRLVSLVCAGRSVQYELALNAALWQVFNPGGNKKPAGTLNLLEKLAGKFKASHPFGLTIRERIAHNHPFIQINDTVTKGANRVTLEKGWQRKAAKVDLPTVLAFDFKTGFKACTDYLKQQREATRLEKLQAEPIDSVECVQKFLESIGDDIQFHDCPELIAQIVQVLDLFENRHDDDDDDDEGELDNVVAIKTKAAA